MNILEAEDMVKGLPDQVLFQYAQNPPPQIPQFLAISEVQRRQEMRQRFQAQGGNAEPTIKDQILQGGIASAGGPPPGGEPPPMAPPGAAPPGAPMQQPMTGAPMGMYQGGQVPYRMQEGRTVPDLTMRMKAQNAAASGPRIPLDMDLKSFVKRMLPTFDSLPPAAQAEVLARFEPQYNTARANTQMFNRASVEDPSVILNELSGVTAPARPQAVAPPVAAPAAAPNAAPAASSRPPVSPGGIVNAGAAMAGQRTAAPAAGSQSALSLQSLLSGLASNERPTEVQAAIDLQRQQMEQGLPPPVDISQFIQSAQQRQKEAKDEARRMAIAGTLTSLGAGVMGGDPAAGLRQATQTAMSTLAEGRREASAEGRMAEQLQLQAAQQQRQAILDTMKFKSDAVNNIANIVSGEQKATRSDKLQAAQLIATYQANREKIIADERVQLGRNANSAQAARSASLKIAGDYIAANPTLTIKKDGQRFTPEEVSKLTRDFAMSLDPEAFGGSSASATLSKADQEALAWANSNPNDPRASQIKAKLGVP